MKKNVSKAMDQMAQILAGPTGKTDRTLAKQEKIHQAVLKEDRMIYAMVERKQYCLDQLPDLDEDDEQDHENP